MTASLTRIVELNMEILIERIREASLLMNKFHPTTYKVEKLGFQKSTLTSYLNKQHHLNRFDAMSLFMVRPDVARKLDK